MTLYTRTFISQVTVAVITVTLWKPWKQCGNDAVFTFNVEYIVIVYMAEY